MKQWPQAFALSLLFGGAVLVGSPGDARAFDGGADAAESTYSWSGFHIGAGLGYRTLSVDADSGLAFFELTDESAIASLEAGYDFQYDRFVIGLLGDLTLGKQSDSASAAGSHWQVETGASASVKGRVGYAFDNVLPFVTAGVALSDVETSFTPAGLPLSKSGKTLTGWTLGAGVEYGITDNWSLKLDYSFADYGKETFQYTAPSAPANYDITTHTVKFGTSLRF